MTTTTGDRYVFGDNDQAGARLKRLAELYEPETRALLQRGGSRRPRVAIDLGCGPGWSTALVHQVLQAERTIGLDASERYVAEARRLQGSKLEFFVHDITDTPFPVEAPDALFCRFLLSHLRDPQKVLLAWANASAPGCMLFVHETESLETDDPTLRRYYELIGQLQQHYGQSLFVGEILEACVTEAGWRIVESKRQDLKKPIGKMAELHLPNVRTWRQDAFARQAFAADEIDALEASLTEIIADKGNPGVVVNAVRQIIAQRAGTPWQ